MAASGVLAGTLADALIARGVSVTVVRKITQGVGFIGPALSLVWLAFFASDGVVALAALTVAIGCTAFTQAGFLVNFQEIGPRYVGALHGMANTAGSIAGIVGTYGAGWVLERTGSWNAVLLITAGCTPPGRPRGWHSARENACSTDGETTGEREEGRGSDAHLVAYRTEAYLVGVIETGHHPPRYRPSRRREVARDPSGDENVTV